MRKRLALFSVFAIFMFFVATSWAKPVTLKFGTFEPPKGWVFVNIIKPFFEKVEKDSEGTLKIDMFTGGTLGRNPTKYIKLIQDGVMDIGWVLNSYQPGRFPDDLVFNIPFVANNPMEGTLAANRMVSKGLMEGYHKVVPLGIFCLNQYSIHTTFPVTKPDDLKGVKLRLSGKMQHRVFKTLGGTPVGIPVTKAAETISRGVVKGTILEWNGINTFRIIDITKNHCMVPFGSTIATVLCSKKKYDSLPEKARAAFEKHRGEPLGRLWGEKQAINERNIMERTMKDPKHSVYIPTSQEMEIWKAKIQPAIDAWLKEKPKNELLLKTYKEELAKIRGQK